MLGTKPEEVYIVRSRAILGHLTMRRKGQWCLTRYLVGRCILISDDGLKMTFGLLV